MDGASWFRRWLSRHPLKEPSDLDRAQYTTEVMDRIRALEQPVAVSAPAAARRRMLWLRPALVAMTAAAAVAVVLLVRRSDQSQLTVVQGLDDSQPETARALRLAESPSEDEQWLEETLRLLEEFDEELPEDVFEDWSDDDWLDELQMLDEYELYASS